MPVNIMIASASLAFEPTGCLFSYCSTSWGVQVWNPSLLYLKSLTSRVGLSLTQLDRSSSAQEKITRRHERRVFAAPGVADLRSRRSRTLSCLKLPIGQ